MTIPFLKAHFGYIFGADRSVDNVNYIPSSLKTVTITGGTSIERYAFYYCIGLTSITIPDSVTSIGDYAFSGCSGLTIYCEAASQQSGWNSNWNYSYCPVVWNCNNNEVADDGYIYMVVDGIRYALQDGIVTVAKQSTALSGTIAIPENVTYRNTSYSVTSIGESAFSGCRGLTEITIPDSVTSIGQGAFSSCSGLTEMTIPFVGAQKNGTGATYFGYIFGANNYLDSDDYVHNDDYVPASLKTVTITGSTSIGDSAFSGCSRLTSITIPDSVTWIGNYAFYDCSGLTEITIPGRVRGIGGSAFSGCNGLTEITIPNSVERIGDSAFSGCSGLTSVTIGNGVTWIGNSAFYGCSGLTEITIPDSVRYIYDYAFSGCSGLTEITIPDSVTSIGEASFQGCSGIIEIENGVSYVDKWVIDCDTAVTNVTLSTATVGIADSAFSSCSGLTKITIPDSVTSIGNDAFRNCSGLTSATIPDSVTSIGYSAFSGCSGLTSVTIGNGVASIGDSAFNGCSGLTIYCEAASQPSGWNSNWSNCPIVWDCNNNEVANDGYIYTVIGGIRYALKDGIATVAGQSTTLSGTISVPESVTYHEVCYSVRSIVDWAFSGCSGLTYITIPDSVTSIGSSVFYNCSGLTQIAIPEAVTSIGDYTFYNCSGLTEITIPDSVTSIGASAFYGCSGLTKIYYTGDIASWCGISGLGNLMSSSRMLYIDGKELTGKLVIPDGVTSISDCAFLGCSGLTEITIPDSVTSIGAWAFYGCDGLTSVYYTGTPETWEEIAISGFNFSLTGATRYYYIENEADVPQDGGNYWHYDTDGATPVVW